MTNMPPKSICQNRKCPSSECHPTVESVGKSLGRLTVWEAVSNSDILVDKEQVSKFSFREGPSFQADVERVRSEIKKLFLLCLHSQHHDNTLAKSPYQRNKCLQKLASLIESILYRMAPTLKDYSDISTLQLRVTIALKHIRRKSHDRKLQILRHKKKNQLSQNWRMRESTSISSQSANLKKNTSSSTLDRNEVLCQRIRDNKRFLQANELVRRIKVERNQLVGSNCTTCRLGENIGFWDAFGDKLPKCVRKLFFQTTLVNIWDGCSADRLLESSVKPSHNSLDWSRLIGEAGDNLKAYLEWKAENMICASA